MTRRAQRDLPEALAEACRILAAEGHEHFDLGHASARVDEERYWVKPSGMRLGEVEAADMLLVDLDGRVLSGDREPHSEIPIHGEIYRARRDAEAVIHTHPFHASALAASTAQFQMVSQDSVLFRGGIGRFDTPQLIVTPELGRSLAAALGNEAVALLRNHGLVVAGTSVEAAVVFAVSFERSVATQLAAEQLGGVAPMSSDEVEDLAQAIRARGQRHIERLYQALRSAHGGGRASL